MKKIPPVAELQKICFRTPPDIYRRVSIYFTRLALMFGVSANHITVSRAIFLILGILVFIFAPVTLSWMILGILFFQLVLLLDTMDGAIARYNKEASFFGEALDFTLDHLSSTVVYFFTAGILSARLFDAWHLFWISIGSVVLAQLAAFARALYAEHHVQTELFKHENALLAFFHQDNMRLLLLALTVGGLLHFYNTHALPVLVKVYFEFLVIKLLFLIGFLWHVVRRFPITGHLMCAYVVSLFYVILRTPHLRLILKRYEDTLVAKAALRL